MEQPLDEDTHDTAGLSQFEDSFVSAEEVFNLIINLNKLAVLMVYLPLC